MALGQLAVVSGVRGSVAFICKQPAQLTASLTHIGVVREEDGGRGGSDKWVTSVPCKTKQKV